MHFFVSLADEEFDELCFEFGLELDEIVGIEYVSHVLCIRLLFRGILCFVFVTL